MFSTQKGAQKQGPQPASENGKPDSSVALLTIVGERARIGGKFDIADSIQVECEVGGELNVGGKLVIGEKGVVNANVQTVDAIIIGHYEGTMVATGNVEITETGRAPFAARSAPASSSSAAKWWATSWLPRASRCAPRQGCPATWKPRWGSSGRGSSPRATAR